MPQLPKNNIIMKPKNYLLLAAYLFLGFNNALAQEAKAFAPRLTGKFISVKGDIVIVGNSIASINSFA